MELQHVEKRLQRDNCSVKDIVSVIKTIIANVKSFTFANEDIRNLEMVIVFKNTGGYNVFKTINGKIVVDRLDKGYTNSRELVCLESWNVYKSYKLCFETGGVATLRDIESKEIHKLLFSLVEPVYVKYVIGVEEENTPVILSVDCQTFKGMQYKDMIDCILASYKHSLKQHGSNQSFVTEPECYLVSYSIE